VRARPAETATARKAGGAGHGRRREHGEMKGKGGDINTVISQNMNLSFADGSFGSG